MCDFGHLVPVFALCVCYNKLATVTPDAHTCARVKQRALPAPFSPCRHHCPGWWRRGVGAMCRDDIRGNFTGKMWRNKFNKIQRIKRMFFCSKKRHIKSIIFLHKKSYKTGQTITIISVHIYTIIARIFIMLSHKIGHTIRSCYTRRNDAIWHPLRETPGRMFHNNVCR